MSSATVAPQTLPRPAPAWVPFLWHRALFPGEPTNATRVRWWSLAIVLIIPALLLYPTRSFLLFEPDEGRYAQIPKEMLDRGEWIVPTLQGEPYLDKPPLMYWLVRISYELLGASAESARVVPALCVHLTILAVYLIGRRSIGERGAMWAALLLSVAPGFLCIARLLLLDGLLTLCVTASLLCGFEAVRSGSLRLGWWIAAAVASGLGFLTKGPISEVLLFPPLVAYAFLSGAGRMRVWQVTLFAAIVLGVNLPWYVGIYTKQPEFLGHFFWEHNVMRFLQPFDHLQPVWYYVPILLGGFLPGVAVAFFYLRSILSREEESHTRTPSGGFWLLTGLWCVLFFSLSGSKLPTYILPAFPPLCLALGEYLARSSWNTSRKTWTWLGAFAVLIAVIHYIGIPWYSQSRSPMGRPEIVERYVSDPNTVVVTYPRNVDSVAFYSGRGDFQKVRTKDMNELFVESHFRPRTVVLCTHESSIAGLRDALPPTLRIAESVSLKKSKEKLTRLDKLVGATTPWGLTDILVIEPLEVQQRDASDTRR